MSKYPVLAVVTAFSLVLAACNGEVNSAHSIKGKFVYTAASFGNIYGYAVNTTTGSLAPLGVSGVAESFPSTITFNPAGTVAYVLVPQNNAVTTFGINGTTGVLTPLTSGLVNTGNYPSGVAVAPSGKFAYVTNRDSNDVWGYSINAGTGALTLLAGGTVATGSAPYGLAIDPTGRFVYVTNNNDGTVSAYAINAGTGALTPVPGSPFVSVNNPGAITVNPAGTVVYAASTTTIVYPGTNNGGISAWSIDQTTGALTPIGTVGKGVGYSSIAVNAAGTFVYVGSVNFDGQIITCAVDSASGALTPIAGDSVQADASYSITSISTSGPLMYVGVGYKVAGYTINTSTGALTAVPGSPFTQNSSSLVAAVTP
ncbi:MULTISPECIES: beta-propeller fold lactonase family protein [Paraburkholderia]|uniref:lactonase family protein n=1 Tax=Paraburkholderia TaxID=1822464 RepID=UPI0022582851|nr:MULTISPECIES: beta-propeller fold lactonase family protein [Paraburkholderia]MCX4159968.1 beta-propeller fold lactonase family protein [Paraburkholderia megapolitana]MDN7155468.1 lactonase family protein [Paraburkholderia sp. CHISQ3]MDQ6492512.1 lactonase family protein [Paraburkholderia megapolitana]